MQSFNSAAALFTLKKIKSYLLSDQLNEQWTGMLATTIADVTEAGCTDINVLMYCALCIGRFRALLTKDAVKYKNTNTSTIFGLVHGQFETYIHSLPNEENKDIVLALLNARYEAK